MDVRNRWRIEDTLMKTVGSTDDGEVWSYLVSRGYRYDFNEDLWTGSPDDGRVSEADQVCFDYLTEEFDYGPLVARKCVAKVLTTPTPQQLNDIIPWGTAL